MVVGAGVVVGTGVVGVVGGAVDGVGQPGAKPKTSAAMTITDTTAITIRLLIIALSHLLFYILGSPNSPMRKYLALNHPLSLFDWTH